MLAIILIILVIILLLPVGVDFALRGGEAALKVKLGPFGLRVLPGAPGGRRKKPKKEKKKKDRPRKPKAAKNGEEQPAGGEKPKKKKLKPKIAPGDIGDLFRILLRMLARFRRAISLDVLELHLTVAAPDPYDAVMRYGQVNAAFGALLPLARRAVKIRREDISTDMSFDLQKTEISLRVVATLQIWEILHFVFCALGSATVLLVRVWRASKKAEKAARLKAQGKEK